jgi:hypothetical protein
LDLRQREFTCQESAEIGKEVFAGSPVESAALVFLREKFNGARHGGKRHVMAPGGHSMAKNDTSWAHFRCIELQSGPSHPHLEEPGKIICYSSLEIGA